MISKDKQYRTRDGREVRIYATDGGDDFPVHGAIKSDDKWASDCWTIDGLFVYDSRSICDLIEVKPRIKREVWVNLYKDERLVGAYWTKDKANRECTDDRIACVKVEIDCEEGEGL